MPRQKILRSVGRFLTSGGILIFLLLAFRSVYARVTDGVIAISETSTEYSLIGEWKFSAQNRDGYLMPDFDDSSWQKIRIPANWSQTEFNGTNIGIYRCRIRTGPAFRSLDLGIMTPFIQSAHEVYFNGSLVGRAGLISPDGRILEKSTRVKVYRIPSRLLRPDGDNSLVIRVLGNGGVGGIVQGDFFLGSWESMDRRYINFHLWNGMLMAVFFFVGIYNLLLFFLRMQERSYLFFSLFTNAIGMTITGVKTLGYTIINSYDFNHLILNAGLIVSPACLALYFESHFGRRLPFFSSLLIIVAGIALPIVPVTLLSDSVFGFFIRYILPGILTLGVICIVYGFYLTVLALRSRYSGSLVIFFGYLFFAFAFALDILSYMNIIELGGHTGEGFMVFVFSMTTAIAVKYSRAHNTTEFLNHVLRRRVLQLRRARVEMRKSEKKYRHVIENTSDIIFTLDQSMRILSVNRSIHAHLGMKPERVVGIKLSELLFENNDGPDLIAKENLNRKFEELLESHQPVSLKADFNTAFKEPRELDIRFEHAKIEGGSLIFARASRYYDDELVRYSVFERQKFVIGNYLTLVESLSHRLTMNLHKYADSDMVMNLRIGLREIIINAIEHGNLNITFEEKERALADGTYFRFIQERQKDEKYSARKVTISSSLNPVRMIVSITDQGAGFDSERMITRNIAKPEEAARYHGRGILIALQEFDEMKYNRKGNTVRMVKYLDRGGQKKKKK